ncbi:MAG: polysaccharide lyase, partial [Cytophagaceae bacterium]
MKYTLLLFLLVFFTGSLKAQLFTGFENWPDEHEYIRASWEADGFDPRWVNGFSQSRAFIDDAFARSGDKSLRILFPADGVGPANSGAQAPLRLTPEDEYYASYWFRFSDNFSWGTTNFGGKLPGLAGGNNCSGCNNCDGTNGFSARLMWRPGGKGVLYLYHMDKLGACAPDYDLKDSNGNDVYFERGQWYNIIQRVKVNSGNNHDGEVELWVNGEHALLVENLRFVNNGDKVDNFYFSTFHGGATAGWAPGVDCHIWFDDIKISTNAADIFPPECTEPNLGPDISFCGSGNPAILNTNVDETNRTFNWFRNGSPIAGSSGTLSVSEPGLYRVLVDSLGCEYEGEIQVLNTIPVANLSDNSNICNPSSIQLHTQLDPNLYSFRWYKDNDLLEDDHEEYLNVRAAGQYRVVISGGSCTDVEALKTITSSLPEPVDDCILSPGEVSLSIIPPGGDSGPYEWFDAPYDGTSVLEGLAYSTEVTETKSFYVQDNSGTSYYTGKPALGPSFWTITDFSPADKKMRLIVSQRLTIDSLTVYAGGAQTLRIGVFT